VTEHYDLEVAASAALVIQHKLPEGVAAAVIEFITGTAWARRFGTSWTVSDLRGAVRFVSFTRSTTHVEESLCYASITGPMSIALVEADRPDSASLLVSVQPVAQHPAGPVGRQLHS